MNWPRAAVLSAIDCFKMNEQILGQINSTTKRFGTLGINLASSNACLRIALFRGFKLTPCQISLHSSPFHIASLGKRPSI